MRKPTEREINEFVLKLGIIPNSCAGEPIFKFILKSYCDAITENEMRPQMTALYIEASKKFPARGKGVARSERNLRTMIENVWDTYPHTKTLDNVFEYYTKEDKPSNSLFIAACTSYLLSEIDRSDQGIEKEINIFEKQYSSNNMIKRRTVKKEEYTDTKFDDIPENIRNYIDSAIERIVKESVREVFKYLLDSDEDHQ